MAKAVKNQRCILPVPKGPLDAAQEFLARPGLWIRVGLFFAFTFALFVVTMAWNPPFAYRARMAPLRNLHARTAFEFVDRDATTLARKNAEAKSLCYYRKNSRPLDDLRQGLIDELFEVKQKSYAELKTNNLWSRFWSVDPATSLPREGEDTQKEFDLFQSAFAKDEQLNVTDRSIKNALGDIQRRGLLRTLEHELGDGSMSLIQVYESELDDSSEVLVSEVRMAEVYDELRDNLIAEFTKNSDVIDQPAAAADRLFNWLKPRLPVTLTWDEDNSKLLRKKAVLLVEDKMKTYVPGDALDKQGYNNTVEESVISAAVPLDADDIALLTAEHNAFVDSQTATECLIRTISFFGLFFAIGGLVAGHLYSSDKNILIDIRHFVTCLLYTSPSPRDQRGSRMPSSA